MNLHRFMTPLAAAVALLLGGAALHAQQPQNRPRQQQLNQQQRQELERRVRQQFDQRLRAELGLSSETQARFGRLVQDFRDRRLELSLEKRQLQVRLRREGRREDLTDEEAQELLGQSLRLADDEAGLFREEQEALLTILSPAQLVQLYQWRENLMERLRRAQGVDRGNGNGPGPPIGSLF